MGFLGFGGESYGEREMRLLKKRTKDRLDVERRRKREAEQAERRIKQVETARKSEIERLKKREESLLARAREREALTRKRRSEREARAARFGRYPSPPKVSKKTKRAVARGVARNRTKESKIGWF